MTYHDDLPLGGGQLELSSKNWLRAALPFNSNIAEAIRVLNQASTKIVLVLDGEVLVGTVSDGDIRRSLLKGFDLNSSISNIVNKNPLVVTPEMSRDMVMQLMIANKIHQIPVLDSNRRVLGLHLWDEISLATPRSNMLVIMVGGLGTRLHPFTNHCPKPMLEIAGKPMLEHIILRAKRDGFNHFVLAVHHLAHMIEDYFKDGESLGVQIDYLREESPLGTAGALSLIKGIPKSPFLVTNGDVITDINYGQLIDFHARHSASATMAVRIHEWQNPFGVVQLDGTKIVGFEEKPTIRSYINAGVYVLSPEALDLLVVGARCDMPSLFERLQKNNQLTVAYPMHEPWLDVGRPDDLKLANEKMNVSK